MVKVAYKIDMAMAERDATVATLCMIATAMEVEPEELYSYKKI